MKAYDIITQTLQLCATHAEPGVSTGTLNSIAEAELLRLGGFAYNKNYRPDWAKIPFPETLCVSVNNEIAHGVPHYNRKLQNGDIVTLDLGVVDSAGDCGDGALSVGVGKLSEEDQLLLHYAKKITYAGIGAVRAGAKISDLARAMEKVAQERNFVINRTMCGHGIGKRMHEPPDIPHVTNRNEFGSPDWYKYQEVMDVELKAGQVICLEPCVTNGKDPFGMEDPRLGWVWFTRDGKKSSMFEHMIKVTDDGAEVLTKHFEPFKKTW